MIDEQEDRDPGRTVLSIDVGSQSLRAAVIDTTGQILAMSSRPLETPQAPQPGYAEIDPELIYETLCQCTRELMSSADVDASTLSAISLTVQRGSVVCLDAEGQSLRPAILWMDQRVSSGAPTLPWRWRVAFRLSGQYATIHNLCQQCEARWLAEHEPELWRQTASYLLLSGFLHLRLTGLLRDSVANQVGYLPFDFKRQQWASAGNWKWQVVPVQRSMLPELVPAGATLGQISSDAARTSRLPQGLPVIAAATDKASESLGTGCLETDEACLSLGTQASVNVISDHYVEPIRMLPSFPAPVPDRYSAEVTVVRGFWMVTWFKEQFAALEAMQASEQGVATEQLLDEMIRDIPPGSLGLTLQPFWGGGLRYPGISAKGAVIGFGAAHTRAHFYRAIIEGLAYALCDGLKRIEKKTGTAVTRCLVSGGGSRSDLTMQILADVIGVPTQRVQTHETSLLGAAISAAVGAGLFDSHHEAVHAMSHRARAFEPNGEDHATYQSLFNEVYLNMYAQLRPMYRSIRRITGYPS